MPPIASEDFSYPTPSHPHPSPHLSTTHFSCATVSTIPAGVILLIMLKSPT